MSDVDVLNETLATEYFGIAAYDTALGSGLLDGPTADAARAFRSDHMKHTDLVVEQIVARDGTPVSPRSAEDYAKAYPPLTTAQEIVAYAIELEAIAARSYVASVAEYEDRSLALLGAEIGAVEAQHWAVLLAASGANPVPSPIIEVKVAASNTGATGAPTDQQSPGMSAPPRPGHAWHAWISRFHAHEARSPK